MARHWYVVPLLLGLGAAMTGCGDEVGRLPPSTLSAETSPVTQLQLVGALPKPGDFGADWTLETDSLGQDDYFLGLAEGLYSEHCAWADAEKAGLETVASAYAASSSYQQKAGEGAGAEIAVDSPAKAEERFAYLRRVAEKCSTITYRAGGKDITRKIEVLADPELNADEAMRVRFEDHGGQAGYRGEWWCARAEGLVLCLDGNVPEQTLASAFERARQTLDN